MGTQFAKCVAYWILLPQIPSAPDSCGTLVDMKEKLMSATTKKPGKEKSATKIVPLGDRVVVKRASAEAKTKGGIVLPDTAKDKPQKGEVIAVGDGYIVSLAGESVMVRKNAFVYARVKLRDEPDGTLLEVIGCGLPTPLLYFPLKFINDRGIAARTAQAISQAGVFQTTG